MNILGIGTDIVDITRIERIWDIYGLRFAKHILTPDEQAELATHKQPARFIAKRFAAKEAVAKALGTGFRKNVYLNQIGIVNDSFGKPEIVFFDSTKEFVQSLGHTTSHISIADELHYAISYVILLK